MNNCTFFYNYASSETQENLSNMTSSLCLKYRKVAPPIFKQLKCSPESFLPEMEKDDWMEKSKDLFSFKSKEMYFLVFLKTPWSVLLRSLVALPTSFPFSRLFSPYTIRPAEMYLRICETPMLDFFLFLLK